MLLTNVQKRGFGNFPEFVGERLIKIDHIYMPDDEYPERYIFQFGSMQHIHALPTGEKLDSGNYRFIGLTVSNASMYWNAVINKSVFEFVFDGQHCLRFFYDS